MVKALAGVSQGIRATNYYRASIKSKAADTTLTLFNNQFVGSPTIRNDLANGGYLPENKSGTITAIMVRVLNHAAAPNGARDLQASLEAIRGWDVVLVVNGTEVSRIPVWGCPHPPSWQQGSIASLAVFSSQNSGYMLQFTPHEVMPRQTIQVRLERGSGAALTNWAATTDAYLEGAAVATTDSIGVEVTLQVIDTKAV